MRTEHKYPGGPTPSRPGVAACHQYLSAIVHGFGQGLWLTPPMRTWLQTLVPATMRWRVFAARAMGLGRAAALASLATGWVATRVGPPVTLSLLGVFALAAGGLAAWGLPATPAAAKEVISS